MHYYNTLRRWSVFFVQMTLLASAVMATPAAPAPASSVRIPPLNISSSPAPLRAYVFLPEGDGPHPAVVMLHGCGGAYRKNGQLNARHAMWGATLATNGYVALMLDSFSTRGVQQLCTTRFAARSIKESDRVGDAYAALAYLRQVPKVDARRIAVMGWSHGGGVTLDTITHPPTAATGEGFQAAIAFYPGCTSRHKKAASFHPYAPLLLLIGEADDWTPAEPCKALAAAVSARGESMQIVTYPETYHDFDNPGLSTKRIRTDVPNGVSGAGVTIAPNPDAREDAKQRVKAFLAQQLR